MIYSEIAIALSRAKRLQQPFKIWFNANIGDDAQLQQFFTLKVRLQIAIVLDWLQTQNVIVNVYNKHFDAYIVKPEYIPESEKNAIPFFFGETSEDNDILYIYKLQPHNRTKISEGYEIAIAKTINIINDYRTQVDA